MATAIASGCDFFASWSTEAHDIANTVYAGTHQNGSTGPPAGTTMSFVGRYTYAVTQTELNSLLNAGLSVFFFYENSAIQPSFNPAGYLTATTFAQGEADARNAIADLRALNIPLPLPVYFAIDYDAGSLQLSHIQNYFDGVRSIMGANYTGLYGNGYLYSNLFVTYFCQSRSTGWRGNGDYIAGQNLWQWPPGYSPGGNVVINGHETDGEFAYTTNFGQYPQNTPPPPPTHEVKTATTSTTSAFMQPAIQSLITPADNHDQVIYSNTIEADIPNTLGSHTLTPIDTGVSQVCYPLGNFSTDAGDTFNDFGFIFEVTNSNFNPGTLPAVVIQPSVDDSGKVTFVAAINAKVGSGATISLIINLALLASYNPGILPLPNTVGQKVGYSSIGTSPAGRYSTYRRIALDNKTTGSAIFAHDQDSIPNIAFWTLTGGDTTIDPVKWSSDGAINTNFGIRMDTTNINIYMNTSVYEAVYYRVYKDN